MTEPEFETVEWISIDEALELIGGPFGGGKRRLLQWFYDGELEVAAQKVITFALDRDEMGDPRWAPAGSANPFLMTRSEAEWVTMASGFFGPPQYWGRILSDDDFWRHNKVTTTFNDGTEARRIYTKIGVNAEQFNDLAGLANKPGRSGHQALDQGDDLETSVPNPLANLPTGDPGRPSVGRQYYMVEFERRAGLGLCEPTVKTEARALRMWFASNHADAQQPSEKTIGNNIRPRMISLKLLPENT